ncbi:MAG: HesB/IscA family protein [Candidatus Kryptonium sp.]
MSQINWEQTEKIKITDRAAKEIKQIIEDNNIPSEYVLRIGIKAGGCSGFSYILLFDQVKENDVVFLSNEIKVAIDPKSLFYLEGTELDFVDSLMGRGFVFHNPNATRSCGCGHSFSV